MAALAIQTDKAMILAAHSLETLRRSPLKLNSRHMGEHIDRLKVSQFALTNELPDAMIKETGLRIGPRDAAVPNQAQALIDFPGGEEEAWPAKP